MAHGDRHLKIEPMPKPFPWRGVVSFLSRQGTTSKSRALTIARGKVGLATQVGLWVVCALFATIPIWGPPVVNALSPLGQMRKRPAGIAPGGPPSVSPLDRRASY